MLVYFQGRFLPETQARVSIFDRSLLYGDGLFETVRILKGRPFRWEQHLDRLWRGAAFLQIKPPCPEEELARAAAELIRRTGMDDALLRICLSRGVGPRGYSIAGAKEPWVSLSLHPAPSSDNPGPPRWKLITSSMRLPAKDLLSSYKTANKLRQVLSRAEAAANGADEALLLNSDGAVAESSAANVFWIDQTVLCTPPLCSGALPGITREVIKQIGLKLGLTVRERRCPPDALAAANGIFLSLTSHGIVEVVRLDGKTLARSPLTRRLHAAYQEFLIGEIGSGKVRGWPASVPLRPRHPLVTRPSTGKE